MRNLLALTSILLVTLLSACGGGNDSKDASPAPKSAAQTGTTPVGPGGPAGPDGTGPLPKLKLQRAFGSVSFNKMTGMYAAPDGRMFVTEQAGRVMVFDSKAASPSASVFVDVTGRIDSSSTEMGLLGFALAPDFAQSGTFYLSYTAGNPMRSVISRFKANAAKSAADPANEEVLLTLGQPFVNHNGGEILFGPDGYFYIGFGDGGSAQDPMRNGQNRRVLLGKLLRIDVGGRTDTLAYRIPADNPFAGQGSSSREEIWAVGLRNPWRFSFDTQTGALWLADVGQNTKEEVDIIQKGGNYGWSVMEGFGCLGGASDCDKTGLIPPIIEYPTGQAGNCSVTGGFVYRGTAIPALRGAYVYGDYCSGRIWGLRYDGTKVTEQDQLADGSFMLSSFGVDTAGEIYALQHSWSGGIFKLTQ